MLPRRWPILVAAIFGIAALGWTGDLVVSKSGKIAFTYRGQGTSQIYVVDEDGSNVTQVTHLVGPQAWTSGGGGVWGAPAFSSDGRKIAFSAIEGYPLPGVQIYVMNADGSNVVRITSPPGDNSDPAFSPDGRRIAFDSSYGMYYGQIYIMDADGSRVTRLTNLRYDSMHPVFTPDGRKIVFVSSSSRYAGSQLSSMNVDGSDVVRLTNFQGLSGDLTPAVSPDGTRIAFRCDLNTICVMSADGSNITRVISGRGPAFSPDGRRIAFVCERTICVANADGSNAMQVVNLGPGWCEQPAFGP